jgi:hypothetical protein
MRKLFFIATLLAVLISCNKDEDTEPNCKTAATVRDLRGLDGCGFVFELEDGTRLEPIIRYYFCGTGAESIRPEPTDPLTGFEFIAGKKVMISYELVQAPSICMVGPSVNITCLTEVGMEGVAP